MIRLGLDQGAAAGAPLFTPPAMAALAVLAAFDPARRAFMGAYGRDGTRITENMDFVTSGREA